MTRGTRPPCRRRPLRTAAARAKSDPRLRSAEAAYSPHRGGGASPPPQQHKGRSRRWTSLPTCKRAHEKTREAGAPAPSKPRPASEVNGGAEGPIPLPETPSPTLPLHTCGAHCPLTIPVTLDEALTQKTGAKLGLSPPGVSLRASKANSVSVEYKRLLKEGPFQNCSKV